MEGEILIPFSTVMISLVIFIGILMVLYSLAYTISITIARHRKKLSATYLAVEILSKIRKHKKPTLPELVICIIGVFVMNMFKDIIRIGSPSFTPVWEAYLLVYGVAILAVIVVHFSNGRSPKKELAKANSLLETLEEISQKVREEVEKANNEKSNSSTKRNTMSE